MPGHKLPIQVPRCASVTQQENTESRPSASGRQGSRLPPLLERPRHELQWQTCFDQIDSLGHVDLHFYQHGVAIMGPQGIRKDLESLPLDHVGGGSREGDSPTQFFHAHANAHHHK
jgi:hypothetical protein